MKERQWEFPASSTQRLSTLRRQPNHNNSPSFVFQPDDYINLLAKTRLLEDQLVAEKYKVEAVERKAHQNIHFIQQLQLIIDDLRVQLDLANKEISRQVSRDSIIKDYEANLRQIGLQIATLNEILDKKNKECQVLMQVNSDLKRTQIDYQKQIKVLNTSRKKECEALYRVLKLLDIDKQPSFNGEITEDLQHIEQGILDMKEKMEKLKGNIEGRGKQYSQSLIQSKQKIISLEYALKLAEERNQDLQKKKILENSFALDKKIEDVIEEMLKKEDDLSNQIIQLQNQNEELTIELQNQRNSLMHNHEIRDKKMELEIKKLRDEVSSLKRQKKEIEEKMINYTSRSEVEVSRYRSEEHEVSKKYRQCEEENKRLRLLIIELESDKEMLEREISVRMDQDK